MYSNQVEVREFNIDNVGPWVWPKTDRVAWENPARDWMHTHRDAFLAFVKKRDVVIQAGGNCGMYPRLFAQYFNAVYTFEPDPLNFYCLTNNCQLDSIVKIQAAVGEINQPVSIERPDQINVGMNRIAGHGMFPQFTIDSLNVVTCDLIQLDVEGYEIHALRGAINTINKFHPVISVETGRGESCHNWLVNLGYELKATVDIDHIYAYPEQ